MATYTVSTFTIDGRRPLPMGSGPFGLASGTLTINPYSQTRLAISQITGLFKTNGLLRVFVGPLDASFGFSLSWDSVNKSIYAAVVTTGVQAAEAASTIGLINWYAIGQLG